MLFQRNKITAVLAAVLATAMLPAADADARGRKFSCPLPDKRACMSTTEVYNSTHNGAELGPEGAVPAKAIEPVEPARLPRPIEAVNGQLVETPNRCCNPVRTDVTVKGDTLAVASPLVAPQHGTQYAPQAATTTYAVNEQYNAPRVINASRQEMVVRTAREEPFRVPAQVMRIYISPWEDEKGDLHMGGFVFSEISARKWSVGTRASAVTDSYRLLTLSPPSRDAAQEAKTGTSDATAQTVRAE